MGSKLNCQSDYVEFLEENDEKQIVPLKKYCGDDSPAVFVSARSRVIVHFVQTLNFDGTGWLINFLGVKEGKRR